MSIEHTIYCDGCGMLGDASRISGDHARTRLRLDRGWLVGARGGKDYCEDCKRTPVKIASGVSGESV